MNDTSKPIELGPEKVTKKFLKIIIITTMCEFSRQPEIVERNSPNGFESTCPLNVSSQGSSCFGSSSWVASSSALFSPSFNWRKWATFKTQYQQRKENTTINQSINQGINQSINQWFINQSIKGSINRLINRSSINQSIEDANLPDCPPLDVPLPHPHGQRPPHPRRGQN